MDRVRTNPAFRLHDLFLTASQVEGQKRTRDILLRCFPSADQSERYYHACFGRVIDLVQQVEDCINLMPPADAEDHRHCLSPIRNVLTQTSISGSWGSGAAVLNPANLAALRITATALTYIVPETEIAFVELKPIKSSLYEIRKSVGDADLGPRLKAGLLAQISRLLDAIENYKTGGAENLRRASAEALGQIVMESVELKKPQEEPWVTNYWTTLGRLADLVAVAQAGHELGQLTADVARRLLS